MRQVFLQVSVTSWNKLEGNMGEVPEGIGLYHLQRRRGQQPIIRGQTELKAKPEPPMNNGGRQTGKQTNK